MLEDFQGAVADYDRALALRPEAAEAYHNRGAAAESLADHEAAIRDYSRFVELRPNHPQAEGAQADLERLRAKLAAGD